MNARGIRAGGGKRQDLTPTVEDLTPSVERPPRPGSRGERVIHLHVDAPPKPAWGQPCNGCGLCCLTEPCPVGMLLSGRRSGACRLVHWDAAAGCYRCGLMSGAATLRPAWLAAVARRLARRWIASGVGCDADIDAQRPTHGPRDVG